jgi:hypothetical protein
LFTSVAFGACSKEKAAHFAVARKKRERKEEGGHGPNIFFKGMP